MWRSRLHRALFAPAGDGGGGGGGGTPTPTPTPAPAPAPTPTPESFSREYVTELRTENASWRTKAREAEERATQAANEAKKAQDEANNRVTEATTAAEKRILMAELKASALKAGMVDLDGLKLADLSSVKLNDKGEVEGADALMESLKTSKPWLFGTPSSSSPSPTPKPAKPEVKKATEMDDKEYAAEKAKLLGGGK